MIGGSSLLLVAALAQQQGPGPRHPQKRPAPPPPLMPADVDPVTTTPSGLKYCVLHAGSPGESPHFGDPVRLNYSAWHSNNGAVIETTRDKTAVALKVGDMNEGVNEALMLMTAGSTWKVVVPPALAFGERGNPPTIQPNETLVFEIELLSFTRGPKLPEFHAGDPAKQKKSESGLVYEPLVEGEGAPPKPDDVLDLRYAIWNTKGRLIDCTELRNDFHFLGRVSDLPFRVLQIAPQYMKPGSTFRFEVPADLGRGLPFYGSTFLPAGAATVWELQLVSVKEVVLPPFVKPDPAQQKKTASGLKYEVLTEGSGASPKLGDKLDVVYSGWFLDGTLFDSSLLVGKPYLLRPFQSSGLIAGWIEGLQLMKAGAKYRFEVPPNLAYGEKGFQKIPPNSTLVFEIELLKVEH